MISGKRINLRAVAKEDVPFLHYLIANEEVLRYVNPYYACQKDRIINSILDTDENRINLISELKDHTPIGLFLNNIEWKRQNVICTTIFAELNISGAGFESIGYLLKFFRDELNLRRIEFEVFDTNKRMQKLFRFLQYKERELLEQGLKGETLKPSEPELRRRDYYYGYGKYIDLLSYSFLIDQWDFKLEDILKFTMGYFGQYYGK